MIKAPSDDALRSRPIGFAVFFRLMMPSIDVRSSTLGTVTIRCIPTLSTNSNASIASRPSACSSSVKCSGTCAKSAAPESLSTCAISAFVWPRAIGTAIAPHIHVACIAAAYSGPGTADIATRSPLRTSSGGGSCVITPSSPSPSSGIRAKVARMESASASACARSVP